VALDTLRTGSSPSSTSIEEASYSVEEGAAEENRSDMGEV
jgi:hypothetical protein